MIARECMIAVSTRSPAYVANKSLLRVIDPESESASSEHRVQGRKIYREIKLLKSTQQFRTRNRVNYSNYSERRGWEARGMKRDDEMRR